MNNDSRGTANIPTVGKPPLERPTKKAAKLARTKYVSKVM
jgi:hypothetical protein